MRHSSNQALGVLAGLKKEESHASSQARSQASTTNSEDI